MHATSRWIVTLVVAQLTLWMGCDQAAYELAPVSGSVTLDGEPLVDAVVVFQPRLSGEQAETAPGSVGRTDDAGRYVLKTVHDEPGAAPGRHRVRIYSHSPESAPVSDSDAGDTQELVPDRFNYRSQLIYEVPFDGTAAANFDLTTSENP